MAERDVVLLGGGCDCGRNQYAIQVPSGRVSELLKIRFDGSSTSLREYSSPASVFLRVPLASMQSTTYAYYPDESHSQIRRSYVSQRMPNSKKFFCGLCSELLSIWTEDDGEDDHINVNWHTLEQDSKGLVEDLGVLPDRREASTEGIASESVVGAAARAHVDANDADHVIQASDVAAVAAVDLPVGQIALRTRNQPWYEEILQGSALGHLRKRSGVGVSVDGRSQVEWEIVEYFDDGDVAEDSQVRTSKRQQISKDDGNDAAMSGVH